MSRKAELSLWGLYLHDKSLFDGMMGYLPQYTDEDDNTYFVDGFTLRDNILLECAELEVVYPDPDFCKQAMTTWAKMRADVWQELYDTMFYVYDPIENYYRREHWTDDFTHGHKKDTDLTYGHKMDTDLTHGHKVTMDVKDTTTNSVTGYNGANFSDRDKSVFENKDSETHSGKDTTNETHSGKDTTNETNSGTDKGVKDGYARGNIGVMSTQQMIKMQRETVTFNLYDIILQEFKERFCLLVY